MTYYHPGIYQFELPFLTASFVPDENDLVMIKYCDVEIHVGRNKSPLITVLISTKKEGMSPTNFIENVVDVILKGYLPQIVIDGINKADIRWIQREYYPEERFHEVQMKWNKNQNRFCYPNWVQLEDDWIMKEHKLVKY
ncbi:hypothetical protein MHH37_15600 [Solibacillus sp. FSL K6-1781]|uniref:hypothetical protein n=1 Tax=Solibacillus sp. FSL K6-1781 TaxID=2921474 RepID=UPI00315B1ED8